MVSGKVVQRAPFGCWVDIGYSEHAFLHLPCIPPDKNGRCAVPQAGETVTGVIVAFINGEPRLSLLPEQINNPRALLAR
jgi:hypothetical protein